MTSCKRENRFGSRCDGDGDVAGEGTIVGVPKFHSRCKCIMPRISIQIGCPMLPLACVLYCIIYYVDPLIRILGCNINIGAY